MWSSQDSFVESVFSIHLNDGSRARPQVPSRRLPVLSHIALSLTKIFLGREWKRGYRYKMRKDCTKRNLNKDKKDISEFPGLERLNDFYEIKKR